MESLIGQANACRDVPYCVPDEAHRLSMHLKSVYLLLQSHSQFALTTDFKKQLNLKYTFRYSLK